MCAKFKPSYYALLYSMLKSAAEGCGWALAIHGSLAKDLDLVAVAWTTEATSKKTNAR